METEQLKQILQSKYPEMDVVPIRHEDLVYEERVRLKCLHCANYMTKWTCPGRLPQLDFRRIINEYEHLAVVISRQRSAISGQQPVASFRETANGVHKAMLYLEKELFSRNEPFAESFIGGCCQLCEGGCPKEGCAHPEQARVPWDATGCNVTRSLANIGIEVDFSDKEVRHYGLLVW